MVAKMDYGNLVGTLILLLLFAALFTPFDEAATFITNHTTGITQQMGMLLIPFIILLLMANLWETEQ